MSRGIAIFLVPFYTRIFTPNDYGIIDLLAISSQLIVSIFPLEITQAIARFYPDTKVKEEKVLVSSISFIYTFSAFSIFLILAFILAPQIVSYLLDNSTDTNIVLLWALSVFFTAFLQLFQNQLKWRLEPHRFAIVSLTYTIITLTLTIFFVIGLDFKLAGVFGAQLCGALISSSLSYYFARHDYRIIFNYTKFKEMLRYSIPLVPATIGAFFLNTAHRILIKSIMTLADLGLFGVGSRLTSLVTVIMNSFQGALNPLIVSKYKEPSTPIQIEKLFRYFVFFSLSLYLLISVFAKEILIIFTTPAYYNAYTLVPFLLLDRIFYAMYVFAPGLILAKRTPILAFINITAGIVNIAVSIIGIITIGLIGAAIGTMVSSMVMFITQMHYSQKYYYVPHNFKILTGSLFIITTSIVFSYMFMNFDNILFSILIKSIYSAVSLSFLMLVGLIDTRELFLFLKKLKKK